MQSTDVKEIKVALWEQAFRGGVEVRCPMGRVVAIRRHKGHLLAMVRGWPHWYPVECVTIEGWSAHWNPAYGVPLVSLLYIPTHTKKWSHDEIARLAILKENGSSHGGN
jgi:hypothetical protein